MKIKDKKYNPPFLAELILKTLLDKDNMDHRLGDFNEIYERTAIKYGLVYAIAWYWFYVIRSIPKLISNRYMWGISMFKNYFKVALRNMLKHKFYSFINLSGLVLGFSVFLIFAAYIYDELSYDRFHENSDRTYRVYLERVYPNSIVNFAGIASGIGPTIKAEIPGIEKMVRVHSFSNSPNQVIGYQDKRFVEANNLYFADSNFFDVFDTEFITGDKAAALKNPNSVVISDETAKKYFGNDNPIGKTLTFRDTLNYTITGVVKKFPQNSHFRFDFLVSGFTSIYTNQELLRWGNEFLFRTYIVLNSNTAPDDVESKLPALARKYMPAVGGYSVEAFDEWMKTGNAYNFRLEKLTDIHLYSTDKRFEFEPNGNVTYLYLFTLVGFFVLFISCFNFMNLITAKSSIRAKEIGVRKVMGSDKKQIVYQFMGESILAVFLALIISIPLVKFSLSFLSSVMNKDLSFFNFMTLQNISIITIFTLTVGIFSGLYPSFFLSKFQPVKILKGNFASGIKNKGFRNLLISIQFGLSVAMVIATLIIFYQMEHMSSQRLGFNKEQVLVISNARLLGSQAPTFIQESLQRESVLNVSHTLATPGNTTNMTTLTTSNGQENISASFIMADENFLNTLEIDIVAGRNFRVDDSLPEISQTIIVNEAFAKILGGNEKVLGKEMRDLSGNARLIVGVSRNFNFESLHSVIKPLVFFPNRNFLTSALSSALIIKVKPENLNETIKFIENKWNEFVPSTEFGYSFLDEEFNKQYASEQKTLSLFYIFALIAIFVACLGLLGLSTFASEQRAKEIGIRKVLGAGIGNIILTLSYQFLKPIILANVLGWLIAYFVMNNWLEDYAYRIDLSLGLFAAASVLIFLISFATIAFQSYKAAIVNPVKSISSE